MHHPILKEQPIFIEKIIKQAVEVESPIIIKSPPETKYIQQPVIVEKQIVKEIHVPIEKTKVVHQPIYKTVEKPIFIEKIVDRPVVQTVEKIIDRVVDRPVLQTLEKIVDRPVYIEKIVETPVIQTIEKPIVQTVEKFIDRPVPYPVPIEKHVFHKPDFHVIAKTVPHRHKLFDFDALLGFLTKKPEVKHIYVPANPHYQLNFNKHQFHASHYSTIEPVKEAPLADYSHYATSHLNPIKPVYGVPSTVLHPLNQGYSQPDPYAGKF